MWWIWGRGTEAAASGSWRVKSKERISLPHERGAAEGHRQEKRQGSEDPRLRELVAYAAFGGGVAFAGVDDPLLFFAFLVGDDERAAVGAY
jgi:hypothetical protein